MNFKTKYCNVINYLTSMEESISKMTREMDDCDDRKKKRVNLNI